MLKKNHISSVFIFIILWILYAFNFKTADSDNYRSFYLASETAKYIFGLEPGFMLFMRFSNKLGLNYNQFLGLYSLCGFCFLWAYIKRFTNHTSEVLLLYALFPFFFQVVQIRFFMSSMISLWGFHFLVERKSRYKLKFFITIIIASSFHISALFYFFMYITLFPWKKMLMVETGLIISIFVAIKLGISAAVHFVPKLSIYLINSETRFLTKVYFVLFYSSILFIVFAMYKKKSMYKEFNKFACKSLIVSITYFPLIWFSMDFTRPVETIFIHLYFLLPNVYKQRCNRYIRNKELCFDYFFTVVFMLSAIFILGYLFSYTQVLSVLQNNLVFGF